MRQLRNHEEIRTHRCSSDLKYNKYYLVSGELTSINDLQINLH